MFRQALYATLGVMVKNYEITTLQELRDKEVDMFSTVIIGNSQTEVINGKLVTPRGYKL